MKLESETVFLLAGQYKKFWHKLLKKNANLKQHLKYCCKKSWKDC